MINRKHIIGGVAATLVSVSAIAIAAPGSMRHDKMAMLDTNNDGTITQAEALAGSDKMFARMDANRDGKIDDGDRAARHAAMFDEADANKDGSLTKAEYLAAHEARRAERQAKKAAWKAGNAGDGEGMRHGRGHKGGGHMGMKKADANGDGAVTAAEFRAAATARFAKHDTNSDGSISAAEREAAKAAWRGKGRGAGPNGDAAE